MASNYEILVLIDLIFFLYIIILIKEEIEPKGTTFVVCGGPLYLGNKRRDLEIGLELKIFGDACLVRLKVISCWEDGRRKRVKRVIVTIIIYKYYLNWF